MYVLDTDVISRTSPLSTATSDVRTWIEERAFSSYLCSATLAELHLGLERLRRKGASTRAEILAAWIVQVRQYFDGRTLAVDAEVAQRTGEFLAKAEAAGQNPGFVDACIAATASSFGFEVITFNARHFACFEVPFRAPEMSRP